MVNRLKKIIIIEDSRPTLLTLEIVITNLGFVVEGFETAEAALQHLHNSAQQPDLILTDLHLDALDCEKGLDGIELIQEIKKINDLKDIPILLLTSETSKEKRFLARDIGAQGWLVKPITRAKLKDVIDQFI